MSNTTQLPRTMNTPSDQSLKLALAKMLPDQIEIVPWKANPMKAYEEDETFVAWKECIGPYLGRVRDTEMLHVCWLVEQELTLEQSSQMVCDISRMHAETSSLYTFNSALLHASWQSRVVALAKVKGVEL